MGRILNAAGPRNPITPASGLVRRLPRPGGGGSGPFDPVSLGFAFLIDARVGNMLTDISGNGHAVSLPGGTVGDGWTPSDWYHGPAGPDVPCVYIGLSTGDGRFRRLVDLTIPQPFTVVMVLDSYTGNNLYRDSNFGAVGYRLGSDWALYAGTVFDGGSTLSANAGKRLRIDVVNGASSLICRGATEVAGDAGTTQGISGTLAIGSDISGASFSNAMWGVFGIIPRAINATERANLLTYYQAAYRGLLGN